MDITFIRTFLELSQSRHFGKTAQALFITQSAVSARIRHLEEQLGVKLLTRDRNNIQLTPAGVRFQRHAEGIVSLWNMARQETALVDEKKALVSIGGMFSLWDTVLTSWLGLLRGSRTDLALRVEALDTHSILSEIREGALDLGFLFEAPNIRQLNVLECGMLELVLVSNREDLKSTEAVNDEDYILVDWGTEFLGTHARLFPEVSAVNTGVNLGRLALDQIVRFGGSAYLAREMVELYVKNGVLFYVKDAPVIKRNFYVAFAVNNPRMELIESILDLIFSRPKSTKEE